MSLQLPEALLLPECEKGIGHVISAPDAAQLIDGVRVQPYTIHADDRGYFAEIVRMGQGLTAGYPAQSTQVSAATGYPGTIKAFHFHLHQTDCWAPLMGMFQVALVDLRRGSRSHGVRNTLYLGALRPWQVIIPAGVGHGYKVLGMDPGILVYITDRFYNPADEGRIPYNNGQINYDWDTQHK